MLAWAGLDAGERVGGIAMTKSGLFEINPQRSKRSVLRLLRLMESAPAPSSSSGGEAIDTCSIALSQLKSLSRPGARLLLSSDLTALLTVTSVEKTLRDIVSHRQVVCFKITDPLDAELPLREVRADGWKQADKNGYVDAALAQRIQRRL